MLQCYPNTSTSITPHCTAPIGSVALFQCHIFCLTGFPSPQHQSANSPSLCRDGSCPAKLPEEWPPLLSSSEWAVLFCIWWPLVTTDRTSAVHALQNEFMSDHWSSQIFTNNALQCTFHLIHFRIIDVRFATSVIFWNSNHVMPCCYTSKSRGHHHTPNTVLPPDHLLHAKTSEGLTRHKHLPKQWLCPTLTLNHWPSAMRSELKDKSV